MEGVGVVIHTADDDIRAGEWSGTARAGPEIGVGAMAAEPHEVALVVHRNSRIADALETRCTFSSFHALADKEMRTRKIVTRLLYIRVERCL